MNIEAFQQGLAFKDDDQEAPLNEGMGEFAFMDCAKLIWSLSPAKGVERKRLELIGEVQPELTTLVRFQPGSRFDAHTHDGGEEFMVLEGIFSDVSGDYGAGSYVRNPPGTRHAPFTEPGCTLFVKLRQFQTGDQRQFSIDTNKSVEWETLAEGTRVQQLHQFEDEEVYLVDLEPGARFFASRNRRGAELFVLGGSISLMGQSGDAHAWYRIPPGQGWQASAGPVGAQFYLRLGPADRYLK